MTDIHEEQKKIATGVTDGSLWRKRQIPNDIIAMARYAGIEDSNEYNHLTCTEVELRAFAKLIAEREREVCANIAENWRCNGMPRTGVANEIRTRGEA
jgi:hypothetical protein